MAMRVGSGSVRILIGLAFGVSALLTGCGTLGVVKPEQDRDMLAKLADGSVILDCGIACSGVYIFNQNELWQRYEMHDWHGLGIAAMRSGWRQDINYFFLGRAAEGLGYPEAADRYYRMAGALATGPRGDAKCISVSRLCRYISLPRDIYPRLTAVSEQLLAQRRAMLVVNTPRRAQAVPSTHTVPSAQTGQPAVANKPPVASTARAGGDEWIDPPPESH